MTTALAVQPSQALDRNASAAEIRAQVNLIQEVMKAVMQDGTHFGTIPGTDKPTLYKAGSEKILATFRIGCDPQVEDLSTLDQARFRVRARGFHQGTGADLGWGVGEASSNEEKYRWRVAVCQEEWDEAPLDRRRKKWKKGRDEAYAVLQVRSEPADLANTVLKIAKKRAQIDMTLTVTAASDVFTQDIEDLPEEGEKPRSAVTPPQKKTAAANGSTVTGKVQAVDSKSGTKNGKPWTKYSIKVDDKWHSTFDTKQRDIAVEARAAGQPVTIEFKSTDYGRDIETLAVAEPPVQAAPPAEAPPSTANGQLPIGREPGSDDA